jgi:hypothetical protein
LDTSLREANAQIQSRSYFGRFERPKDINRVDIDRVAGVFKIGFLFTRSRALIRLLQKKNKIALPYELFRSFSLCFIDPVRRGIAANRASLRVIQGGI